MNSKPFTPMDCEKAIRDYIEIKPQYDLLSDYLQALLKKIADDLDLFPIIQGRSKSLESYSEKIYRENKHYVDPLKDLTDLCGVRFIAHTLDQVEKMKGILPEYFIIDKQNSEDKKLKLSFSQFGYLSTHYIIQLGKLLPLPGFDMDKILKLKPLKAELQLRTLAQHIWADIYHELGYKNEFHLPEKWEREFARTAAFLENCDKSFQEIKNDISIIESNYGSYISHEKLELLKSRLEVLNKVDPGNPKVLHRLVKAYVALSNWHEVETLYKENESVFNSYYPLLREAGFAICKANPYRRNPDRFNEGQELIRRSLAINGKDVESHCCLGGTFISINKVQEALNCYKKAHMLDPSNPYPLGNYIACELLLKKDISLLDYFHPLIAQSIERCKKQVAVKTNYPWVFYDLGLFSLLLNKPYESLSYYAKALDTSLEMWEIKAGGSRIEQFLTNGLKIGNIEEIFSFLKLGERIKSQEQDFKNNTDNSFEKTENVLIVADGCNDADDDCEDALNRLEDILSSEGKRYTRLMPASGTDNTISQTIAFWNDYLNAGGDPQSVKLIGFNTGCISSCEYRMALAFGAKAGIIKGVGKQTDSLLDDPVWHDHLGKNLHALDLNNDSIRRFF